MEKNKILIGITILVVVGLVFYFLLSWKPLQKPQVQESTPKVTIEELKKIKVPEKGEKAEEGIAVPSETAIAAPNAESNLRIFEIKGENGELNLKRIIVYQNDIVNIKFFAVDKDYDFSLPSHGIQAEIKKGENKTIEFQANNLGKFDFYCSLCQTKENKAGDLVIVPRK